MVHVARACKNIKALMPEENAMKRQWDKQCEAT